MVVPDISVLLITYNHERYVTEALESILMQRGPYSVEIVVADDASTDKTSEILQRYINRVRFKKRTSNVGIGQNVRRGISECRGEYIAFLEGDDYWSNPLKLKLQIEHMMCHPDHALVHHLVNYYDQASGVYSSVFPPDNRRSNYPDGRLLIESNFIQTCSLMCRASSMTRLPAALYEMTAIDWPLCALITQENGIGFINEIMATYRIHECGVWSSATSLRKIVETRRISALMVMMCAKYQRASWTRLYRWAITIQLQEGCSYYLTSDRRRRLKLLSEVFIVNYRNPIWIIKLVVHIARKWRCSIVVE